MSLFEKAGIPSVSWTANRFAEDARWSANTFGCPEMPIAVVGEPFTNQDPGRIHDMVDANMQQVINALTQQREILTLPPSFDHVVRSSEAHLNYSGKDLLDCFDAMQTEFIKNGWSDGMPLVPPTPEKVAAMVAASGRKADEVVGIYAPGFGVGTVEKIAANAVMAGCKPAAMPVVLAVAECVLQRLLSLRTFAMSTGPQAPVITVSGPYAKEIGMNNGICALGPGSISQVNVSIGRTLRLMMMNVGHSYPAVSDMDTIGTSMKFSACVAENEERNPWEPYRVSKGYSKDATIVTVNVPYGVCELFDFQNHDPNKLIKVFGSAARNLAQVQVANWLINTRGPNAGHGIYYGEAQNLILMCPDHAQAFGRAGWSLRKVKEELFKVARAPFDEVMLNKPVESFIVAHPELQWLWDNPRTEVSLYPSPESFDIFVVGGDAGRSLYHYGGTLSLSTPVKLPGKK
ncbi:MAG: hypothetical protein EXR49_02910 [Dehalococcoidia bacterium]|nr:hypothetical protein [Dehalococcoidia bacterium]